MTVGFSRIDTALPGGSLVGVLHAPKTVWLGALAVAGMVGAAMLSGSPDPCAAYGPRCWVGDRTQFDAVTAATVTGSRFSLTDSLRPHDHSVWIDEDDDGLVVDPTPLECHGGRLHVTWHIGNLEPARVGGEEAVHLSARLDGEVIGTVMRAGKAGTFEDSAMELHTVIDCPVGPHLVDLVIPYVTGVYGFPYVTNLGDAPRPDLRVMRGFILEEVWG